MADERKIVVEILSGAGDTQVGGETDKTKKNDPKKILSKQLNTILHPIQSLEKEILGTNSQWILSMANQAISMVKSAVDYEHNRFFTLKEDYIGANTYANVKQGISNAASIFGSFGAGAISGAVAAGPVGAIVGSLVSGGFTIANKVVSKLQKQESYQMSLNSTNAQTSFGASRASLYDGGRGTEN